MTDLLIVGNGFDLYHGLPTRYTDFLKFISYWSIFWDNYNGEAKAQVCTPFRVKLSEQNEIIEESMRDFASHQGYYKYEHLEFINSHIDNLWIQYFLKKQLSSVNWIDFEGEIYNVLKLVEEYYSEFIPEMRKRNDAPIKYIPGDMSTVINIFKKNCPEEYIDFTQEIISRSDTEKDKLKNNKEMLLSTMKRELDDLIKCLDYYLLDFVSNIKVEQYSEQIKELSYINLLNFNYTYTYASVYGKNSLREHHRIHGDCLEEDMVLGIPDESFPSTLDYIYFQKYFQRIQKRTGNYYKSWITEPNAREKSLEDVPINVFIMGHSLADSDKGILKEIFMNDFVCKITIFYHSQLAYEQQVINLVSMFGKDFVIEQTANDRIVFEKLKKPQKRVAR